jgi:hypothetical protein
MRSSSALNASDIYIRLHGFIETAADWNTAQLLVPMDATAFVKVL